MHELGITQNIIDIVSKAAGSNQVLRVKVEVGELSAVSPEALLFCFDLCCKDTVLEKAKLEIEIIQARGKCKKCSLETNFDEPPWFCICGSREIQCIGGMELNVKEMEIAQCV